jgi:hypothetical protein
MPKKSVISMESGGTIGGTIGGTKGYHGVPGVP